MCGQLCCKTSGHKHELLGGWEIFCTILTEWLLKKAQVVACGACCKTWWSDNSCIPDQTMQQTRTSPRHPGSTNSKTLPALNAFRHFQEWRPNQKHLSKGNSLEECEIRCQPEQRLPSRHPGLLWHSASLIETPCICVAQMPSRWNHVRDSHTGQGSMSGR